MVEKNYKMFTFVQKGLYIYEDIAHDRFKTRAHFTLIIIYLLLFCVRGI